MSNDVIVGGGLAGAKAAAKLRELDPTGDITLIGDEDALIRSGEPFEVSGLADQDLPLDRVLRTPHTR